MVDPIVSCQFLGIGCRVLTADWRVSLSLIVVCSWLSGVGCRMSVVGYRVSGVGCWLLIVGVDCRSLFPLSVPNSALISPLYHIYNLFCAYNLTLNILILLLLFG